jgi:hypothetical protein
MTFAHAAQNNTDARAITIIVDARGSHAGAAYLTSWLKGAVDTSAAGTDCLFAFASLALIDCLIGPAAA